MNEFIDRFKHLSNGEINYNNNDSLARGEAFWIRNDLKEYVEFVHGFVCRFVYIKYKDNEETFDMINVFAPNKVADRSSFFKNISDIIPMSNSLMILGDFNNTFIEIDRCGKTVHTYDKCYNALFEFMNKHSVDDILRNKNNSEKKF